MGTPEVKELSRVRSRTLAKVAEADLRDYSYHEALHAAREEVLRHGHVSAEKLS